MSKSRGSFCVGICLQLHNFHASLSHLASHPTRISCEVLASFCIQKILLQASLPEFWFQKVNIRKIINNFPFFDYCSLPIFIIDFTIDYSDERTYTEVSNSKVLR
jgi:hypothetical protein